MSDGHESAGESAAATAMTVGCVIVVLLLMIGGALSWFMLGRAQVAERAMALDQAMAEMAAQRLPQPVRDLAGPQFQRIHAAVDRGELEGQAAVVFIASITSSPEFLAGALFEMSAEFTAVEGLTESERAESESRLVRLAGGVLDRTVPTEVAQAVLQAAPSGGAADELRAWIDDVGARCDALGLREPARRVGLEATVERAVDAALEGS